MTSLLSCLNPLDDEDLAPMLLQLEEFFSRKYCNSMDFISWKFELSNNFPADLTSLGLTHTLSPPFWPSLLLLNRKYWLNTSFMVIFYPILGGGVKNWSLPLVLSKTEVGNSSSEITPPKPYPLGRNSFLELEEIAWSIKTKHQRYRQDTDQHRTYYDV